MGGGGGGGLGIIGDIINVASVFYPPLRPIAMVVNGIGAAKSLSEGNIFGAVTKGFGAASGLSSLPGMDAGSLGAASDLAGAESFAPSWGNATADFGDLSSMDVGQGNYAMDADQIAYNPNDIMEQMGGGGNIDPNNINNVFTRGDVGGLSNIFDNAANAQFNAPTLEQAGAANDFLNNSFDMSTQSLNTGVGIPQMGTTFGGTGVGTDSLAMSDTSALGGGEAPTATPEWGDFGGQSGDQGTATNSTGSFGGGGSADVSMANDPGQYGFGGSQSTSGNMFQGTSNTGKNNMNIFEKIMQAQQQSPLQQGIKALGGIDSWMQGRKAQGQMQDMYNSAMQSANFNNARGAAANQMWQQNFQDPMAKGGAFDQWMQGAGGAFRDQAAAKASKGNRAYMNSGKFNTDMARAFMQGQNQRGNSLAQGFANPAGAQVAANFAPAMAGMVRNQNAPLFDAANNIFTSNRLADIFGSGNTNSYLESQYA